VVVLNSTGFHERRFSLVFSSPGQVEDNEDPNEGPKEDGDGDMQRE